MRLQSSASGMFPCLCSSKVYASTFFLICSCLRWSCFACACVDLVLLVLVVIFEWQILESLFRTVLMSVDVVGPAPLASECCC